MNKYVFVGSRAEVLGKHLFTEFGQAVDLDPAEAKTLILEQRIPLLPADKFAATESAPDHPLAAREALHEYRTALAAPPPAPPAAAEIPSVAKPAPTDKRST